MAQPNLVRKHKFQYQPKSYKKTMAFLGETSSQTVVNSTLSFIFPNGSIVHNDSGVSFQASTLVPI